MSKIKVQLYRNFRDPRNKVFIDDHDISQNVQKILLEASLDETVPALHLWLIPESLEIEGELEVRQTDHT